MPQVPCRPFPERRETNWPAFYETGLQDVLYRVHIPSSSHTSYPEDRGFVPSAGVTRRVFDRLALHNAAVDHCLGWFVHTPSPFVSLSCSFGYAVWEAHRRHTRKRSLKDAIIYFVDCRALLRRRPAERYLFHAVELIDDFGPCGPSGCAQGCERAARYANIADELLVLGSVPADTIIGSISFRDLLVRLPDYFFTPPTPSPRDTARLLEGFSRNSYRDAYAALERNISISVAGMSLASHAEAALDIAVAACPDKLGLVRLSAYHVRIIATAIANWIICWSDLGGGGQDDLIQRIDAAWYVNEYIAFRAILCVWEEEEDLESSRELEPRLPSRMDSTLEGTYLQDIGPDSEYEVSVSGARSAGGRANIRSTPSSSSLEECDLTADWDDFHEVIELFEAHMLSSAEPC